MGGRRRPRIGLHIPAGLCDACGDVDWFAHQIQRRCPGCKVGWIVSSRCFSFVLCPDCEGEARTLCSSCNKAGVIATPIEQYPNGEWVKFFDAGPGEVEMWDLSWHGSLAEYDRLFGQA